jgi:acyl-CoA hydrolase
MFGVLDDDPRVIASGNFAAPHTLLTLLDTEVASYRLFMLNAQHGLPDRDGVTLETCFVGAGMRNSKRLRYIPSRLSLVPRLFATTVPPDVVLLHASPPRDGHISLGTEVNVLPAAIEAARQRGGVVVAQLNPKMPFTYGDAQIPVHLVDYAIEVDEALPSPPAPVRDEVAEAIGDAVVERILDGSTLQLGIGSVPDAVLHRLTERRGLRVWSEMFSDGVLELDRRGALDPDEVLTASFLFGSAELLEWVDGNQRVRLLRTETVNEPALIARNRMMTSINTALQVDLFAQANASRIGGRIYSGFGGQTDFIVGALHSHCGQALVALRAWHPKADVSTIVPLVDGPVTSFQHTAMITEHGVAELFGRSERDQAEQLIERTADPRVRADLWAAAAEMGLS